jgi:hypothetical protein
MITPEFDQQITKPLDRLLRSTPASWRPSSPWSARRWTGGEGRPVDVRVMESPWQRELNTPVNIWRIG